MPPISFNKSVILLITALILIQGAAALTIEQAPLNPAFVAYTEGLDTGEINQFSIDCCGDSCPATGTGPSLTGLIPAPGVVIWTDGYTVEADGDAAALPGRFDLRDEGRVTPVRDQGNCGSCWAFATLGSLESTYLTENGEAENFSENNMNNLCSNLYPDGFDSAPCNGGNFFMSSAYLTRGSGPVQEADDPYLLPVPSNISPTDLSPVLDVREITFLPPRTGPLDNSMFQQTLMDEGAISVAFLINWSCFADHDTTYYWPGEEYAGDGGHAVTLVGWDDAYPKENFAVEPPNNGAFILKNSWGTFYGEDGFFYISYYDPRLGHFWNDEQIYLDSEIGDSIPGTLYTGVPADNDKQTYQYDPLGWTTSIGTGEDTTFYGANAFTAESYEALTDVSFYTREPGTEYTVAIFTDFITPPGDAAPVAWTSGTADLPGYHTISLPETVTLMPGEVFSVVLEVSSPTDTYPLVVEMPIEDYSSGATAEAGESYISGDGDVWDDLTTIFPDTNVCIKAHTSPLTVVPRDYATIREAVYAAVSGDTIFVEAGTYPEELVLNKKLTLQGVGMPAIASPSHGIGALILVDNITMAGFSFDGNGEAFGGVGIMGNNCTLYDIDISGYTDGLHIEDVRGLSLSSVALHDNTNNLEFAEIIEETGNCIDETVTVNGRPVIYREDVTGETIDASSDAGAVICVNCTDITIRDTTTEAIADGIALSFCRDMVVENVTADEVKNGLRATFSDNVTVQSSSFGPECGRGMYIQEGTGFLAEENEITRYDHGLGIAFIAVENVTITDNIIDTGKYGIGVLGSMLLNTEVTGNTFKEGMNWGIVALYAENLRVTGNTMDTSEFGIMIDTAWTVTVSDNTIRCNDTGLGIGVIADGADIVGNSIENCSEQGIMILNDSVVRENHFSGEEYPIIDVVEDGTGVYVYRNDFVLTEEDARLDAQADSLIAGTTMADSCWQDVWALPDAMPDNSMWDEVFLSDVYDDITCMSRANGFDACAATAEIMEQHPGYMHVGWDTAVWHSPTEETYWYDGQGFTRTMGNYWNMYNGTDTNNDGIGDTPYIYSYLYYNYTMDIYPLVKPFAWYADVSPDTGGDDPSDDLATTGAMHAGDSATFSFTGTAVQEVTIIAADGTGRVVLTVDPAHDGPDGLTGPVYQYLTAQVSGITDDGISEADFSFRVPAAWLNAEGLLPVDLALWRYHDGAWQELPTSVLTEEGGWVYFEAVSPGFSTFAIAEGDGQNVTVTIGPAMPDVDEETGTDTAGAATTPALGNETAPEPQVTVAIPEEGNYPAESATTPQESPLGFITVMGGAAGALFLFRRQ